MDTSMTSNHEEQHPSLVEESEGKGTVENQEVDDDQQMEVAGAKATVEQVDCLRFTSSRRRKGRDT